MSARVVCANPDHNRDVPAIARLTYPDGRFDPVTACKSDLGWLVRQALDYDAAVLVTPLVTPSRADRQPRDSATQAKGGSGADGPGTTNHPDLVTHHEPGARTPEVAEPRPASGCCRAEGISSEGGPASREHGASTSRQESA